MAYEKQGGRGNTSWSSEQLRNAQTIANVGRSMGMSSRDIQIALMAAIVESGLRNLDYGDRDSVGLFQQRAGWGSTSTRMNPAKSAGLFYSALKRVHNRTGMSLGAAAQRVQVSAFPSRYGVQEGVARALMSKLGSSGIVAPAQDTYKVNKYGGFEAIDPTGMGIMDQTPQNVELAPGGVTPNPKKTAADPMQTAMEKLLDDGIGGAQNAPPSAADAVDKSGSAEAVGDWSPSMALWGETGAGVPGSLLASLGPGKGATGLRAAVLNLAKSYIGRPYVFGANGPSAFDCSSLTQYVLAKMGVKIPRLAYQQARFGTQTSIKNIKPGDLVFWGNSSRSQGNHIAFYLGDNKILEAPRPGLSVRIRSLGGWDKDDNAIGIALNY